MRWLNKQIHASWLIGWLCFGIICGAGLAIRMPLGWFTGNSWLAVIAALLCTCLLIRRHWIVAVILATGVLIGLCRASPLLVHLTEYQPYYGRIVTVFGTVSQDAAIGEGGTQKITLQSVSIDGNHLAGSVWVSLGKADIKRGDTLRLKGTLTPGFGNTAATMYRASVESIIRPYPGDTARRVRDWFAAGVRKAIPEPQVSLGLGYLLGQKTALPPSLDEQIKIVGLTHAVVASGYNLTILVNFSRRLFMKFSKYLATICSCLMVLGFMCVTGFSPSMSRAGLVACLGLVVWYYGRKTHPFVLLSFAAAITILVNPAYVWGDLGWYLSFTSFIGVIVFAPLLHAYFWGRSSELSMLRGLLVETLSAQIITMPLIQYSFGLFSVYALPANVMVLPLVPLAMLCTFLAGIAGLLVPSLAPTLGYPAYLSLRYSTEMIAKWAALPNSQIELKFNLLVMLISYSVLGAITLLLIRRTNYDFRS